MFARAGPSLPVCRNLLVSLSCALSGQVQPGCVPVSLSLCRREDASLDHAGVPELVGVSMLRLRVGARSGPP